MRYVSTRDTSKTFEFKEVFIKGLADDGGLFIPEALVKYGENEIRDLKKLSYSELAKKIVYPFIGNFMPESEMSKIIDKSYSTFRKDNVVDFIKIGDKTILELFHGPTLAFKDFGARFMAQCMQRLRDNSSKEINILVATSGDTGGAAVTSFANKKNIKLFVLYPKDRISEVQRRFMSTVHAENVKVISIDGNFDDCQNIVKALFKDREFSKKVSLTAVNSINWARIMIQIIYYFSALTQYILSLIPSCRCRRRG